jgi:hypothetical protein
MRTRTSRNTWSLWGNNRNAFTHDTDTISATIETMQPVVTMIQRQSRGVAYLAANVAGMDKLDILF